MANLPEKNITAVDKITSIPGNTNLYINANGEFRQATVDDVLKASPVIADSITNQYKNASGSPILLTDSADGVAIDFKVYGRSTQNGTPTPDAPIDIKSVGDMGYFDGELLGGIYTNGVFGSITNYVCSKNRIPCQPNDNIEITYDGACNVVYAFFYDENGAYLSHKDIASNKLTTQAIANAYSFHIGVYNTNGLTVATAKHICVTINDKYALIVDSNNDRKYIPISSPLRGIGEVTDVASLSECKVDRKFTKVVYDGSDDERWSLKAIGCELYLNNTNSGNALCTHYKKNNGVSWGNLQDNEFNIIDTVLRIKDNTHQSTLDEWKAWLQSNPITVIYELAEPTTESIEPIDVDTFEGVTHISVSDDADMEVEYPTSKVAGIASIGWSKGRRAEYDLEQLKVQMLALQTTIVSTV